MKRALLVLIATTAAADPHKVLVWPQGPDDDILGVDAVVREAGKEPVSFTPLNEQLTAIGEAATKNEAMELGLVELAFSAARYAYLKQNFTAMADPLAKAEAGSLLVLARHVDVLWELEFQRGLAELSRGDAAAARRRFLFALALDETRTPKRDIYGPTVARAFTEATDARTAIPPRPVRIDVTPRDARVVIDGVPVVDVTQPRSLRPGLHVAYASAPGFTPIATLVDIDATHPLSLALAPATGTAAERIGPAWAEGTLDANSDSARRAILAAAAELGADAALVIDTDRARGEVTARWIAADTHVERRATAVAAATAVLLPEQRIVDEHHGKDGSILKKWWLWTAVGVVAAAGIGAGFYFTRGDDTVRIHSPM